MTIAFLIGVILFISYVIVATIKFGILPSLSDSFYKYGGKPKGYVFTVAMWATVFLIMPLWFSVTKDIFTFSTFLACGGLLLVGSAPVFKGEDNKWHQIFAIICAVFALLWQILNQQYWEVPVITLIVAILVFITKSWKQCRTFWLEMIAFFSTFLSVGIKSILG